ncbi:MAG: hypothetical protein DRQ89_13570 [Epsilonproteobacteria bacterium]|nr:MAG: hypothetical protein DRQ89_13570 [Campylobacterota bacterium]
MIGCSATSNEGTGSSSYGIYAGSGSTVVECAATSNSNTNSPSSSSQGVGFYVSRSTVKDCTASFNQGDGIQVHSDCLVVGGDFSGNGFDAGEGAGIHLTGSFGDNRIESNTVTDNDRGIDVDSPGNLIIRNSASGNSTDYAIIGTQTIGPIITATGTITNTNPWANFSF